MSIAGPAANLVLVLLSVLAIRLGMTFGVFVPPDTIDATRVVAATATGTYTTIAAFLNVLFSLNLLLFLFNLLPIPPLDGSGMIPLLLSEESGRRYLGFIRRAAFSFIGIMVAWKLFDVIYGPLHLACVNLLYFSVASYQ
jgi:Zn-dependent protease